MTGDEHHFDAAAAVLHGRREGLVGGGTVPLITLHLHAGAGPDAVCDLRPGEARALAQVLLVCARHADQQRETRR
jgi:hypothetical protein